MVGKQNIFLEVFFSCREMITNIGTGKSGATALSLWTKRSLSQSIPTFITWQTSWNRSDVGRNEVVWFGRRQGRDIQDDSPGILPSRAWKREVRGQSWYQGETVISGIGQGFWVTTPLQLAAATTAVARRGNFIDPHFSVREDLDAGSPVPIGEPIDWERMIDAMEGVLHDENGTARGAGRGLNYRIAGKTGTVQIFSIGQEEEYEASEIDERLRDHALFVGFAPADAPSIVIALIIENGGSGGTTAAPSARQIFDYWLLIEMKDLFLPILHMLPA